MHTLKNPKFIVFLLVCIGIVSSFLFAIGITPQSEWGVQLYDTDADGKMDLRDDTANIKSMRFHGYSNMADELQSVFGISPESKLYEEYPDIEEFRVRAWDLNKDGDAGDAGDKLEIFVNGKVVVSVSGDIDGDGGLGLGDVLKVKGWDIISVLANT